MNEEMICNWTESLLENHGVSDVKELTAEQIKKEIEEEIETIENERIWDMHNNEPIHVAYLNYLRDLLKEKESI